MYNLGQNVLNHATVLFLRFFDRIINEDSHWFHLCQENNDEEILKYVKIAAISILCLASKFQERISFKVSELSINLGIID